MRLSRYQFGEFELDPASRELSRRGERVSLPPKSFECLAYLIAHRDRAVGRDELISAVWGRVEVSDTVVAQTLLRARKALGDAGERQDFVRTVPRFGYRWVMPVTEVDPSAPAVVNEAPAVAQATEATTKPTRSIAWIALVATLVLLIGALGWVWLQRKPATSDNATHAPTGDLVLVLPVTVAPVESESAWVRLGAMDYVASRVRSSGLKVVPSDQTLHLSTQLGDAESSDKTAWSRLQADSGARWIVAPEARHDANGWHVRLNLREGGQPRSIEARGNTPLSAAAAATDAWLRRIGRRSTDNERTPSALTERVQRIDAELFVGQIAAARQLIDATPKAQRDDPRVRLREGQLEFRAGRIDEAARLFDAILARRPEVEAGVRAEALMGQGAVEVRRTNWAAAETRYTQALALLEGAASDDPALLGNAYNGRGVALVQQGKMEAAVRDMGLARIAMQRSGNFVEAATVASNLGRIETMRGHYPQALQEFDRAIGVFERFEVRDYLAATLMSKAETQLALVQPGEAAKGIERAQAMAASIEDAYLVSAIGVVRARVLLAQGRLREAGAGLAALRSKGETEQAVQELQIRLAMAKGDRRGGARRLPPAAAAIDGALALAATQSALRERDVATARAWVARAPTPSTTGWDIAKALLAQGEGDAAGALQIARAATARSEHEGAPEERVQAGLLQARLLLAQGDRDAAAALLGDLDAFAATDYRVAWTTLALYRALGDAGMASSAEKRVQALRGERDPAVEPAL